MKILILAGLVVATLAAPQGTAEELSLLRSKLLLFQNKTGASDAEVDRLWNLEPKAGELIGLMSQLIGSDDSIESFRYPRTVSDLNVGDFLFSNGLIRL